jgi:hypothetical protein
VSTAQLEKDFLISEMFSVFTEPVVCGALHLTPMRLLVTISAFALFYFMNYPG